MKERLEYLENKFEDYLLKLSNCHPSMEEFYYQQAKQYQLLIADVKNGDQK